MQKLWIIVPTYYGRNDIPHFLTSLKHSTESEKYVLVVVDNDSRDDTVDIVYQQFPEAHIIQNTENKGFATACNQGMLYAIEHGARFVFLVNQDVLFEEGWLDPLISLMLKNDTIAAVQPKILMYPDTTRINSVGNALHIFGYADKRRYLEKDSEWKCETIAELSSCSFAAVLLRVDAMKKVGLLDDTFFMYHEDSDLSWRFRIAGYSLVVCPQSVVYHRYQFDKSIQKFYYIERNRIIMFLKNYQLKTLFLLIPLFIFWECGMIVYSLLGSLFMKKTLRIKEKVRGYLSIMRLLMVRHIVNERRRVRLFRKYSDQSLTRLFTDTIISHDMDNALVRYVANPVVRFYWGLIKKII